MKFTVVIPTYRRADLVQQAVQSVLAQTFQDFEIVVVDDGSPEPIQPLATDGRVRVVRHETNRGAAAARNTGIRAARGALVAFLDSDDTWLPEKLQRQAALMEDAVYGACVTGYEYDTEEGYSVEIPRTPRLWLRELAMGCRLSPGTTLAVRRSCYETVGFYDEALPRHEDYDWLLRFVQQFDIGVVGEPLARVHRAGQPSGTTVEAADLEIIRRYGPLFLGLGRFFGSRAIGKRFLEIAVHFAREGNVSSARAYLWKAVTANPLQRPGMYLRVMEGLLGISWTPAAKRLLARIRRPNGPPRSQTGVRG
ncbi:MAG: glycosyltransferase family 2 protein [Candidatus Methylomirabilia bacterium]